MNTEPLSDWMDFPAESRLLQRGLALFYKSM